MESKTIVITEAAENSIMGQESVFGWKMKEKKEAGRFLFYKYNQYTLVRDRNPEDVTQAHIDVENKWNNEFKIWNRFVLNGLKKCTLILLISFAMLFAAMILTTVGIIPVGLIMNFLSIVINIILVVIMLKNGSLRLKKMDKISREMRQVNAIRENQ